jgi:hypothetical protein
MTMTMTSDKIFHLAFAVPARVMLMDKSTPLAAVTGALIQTADEPNLIIKTKMLFPCNGGPVKGSITMLVNRAHIVSLVEVKEA